VSRISALLLLLFVGTARETFPQTPSSLLQEAVGKIRQGRPADAVALLEPAVAQAPSDFKALTVLGMALGAAGRPVEANQRFLAALQVNPAFAPALRGLAMNEMSMAKVRDAKTHFEALLKLTPDEPIAHLALGEIYFNEKDYRKSAFHYEQSAALLARDVSNLVKYATACLNIREIQQAVDALARLPENAGPQIHFESGALLAKAGRYDAAARHFGIAWTSHPDPYLAGYNYALAQLRNQNPDAAIQACEQLLSKGFDKKAELQNLLAQAYVKKGRIREAYESLRTATQLDPVDETNYLDLIALCLNHQNLDLGLEISAIGLARLPQSDRLHLQRGVVWAMKGQFEEARDSFDRAAKLAPAKGLPQVALGLVLLQTDRTAEAVEVLRRRAAAVKQDYLVLWFLGEALNRAGVEPDTVEGREAVRVLRRSIQLNPELVPPRVLLAKMLTRAGDLAGASAQLETALKLEPDNVGATYQLAQVLSKKGDSARARELFAKVSQAKAEERDQFAAKGLEQIVREGAQ